MTKMTKKLETALEVVQTDLLDREQASKYFNVGTMRYGRMIQEEKINPETVTLFNRTLFLKASVEFEARLLIEIKDAKIQAKAQAVADKAQLVDERKADREATKQAKADAAAKAALVKAEARAAKAEVAAEAATAKAKAKAVKADAAAAKEADAAAEVQAKPEAKDEATTAEGRGSIEDMSIPQLRTAAKEANLKTTGSKAQLIARLTENESLPDAPAKDDPDENVSLADLLGD